MAKLIRFLDTTGRPRVVVNVDLIQSVDDRSDPTDPADGVKLNLTNRMVRVSNTVDEVIETVNAGTQPDYELDENGVFVGYRKAGSPAPAAPAPAAEAESEVLGKSTGFGAEDAGESPALAPAPASRGKLAPAKTAKTAFGK